MHTEGRLRAFICAGVYTHTPPHPHARDPHARTPPACTHILRVTHPPTSSHAHSHARTPSCMHTPYAHIPPCAHAHTCTHTPPTPRTSTRARAGAGARARWFPGQPRRRQGPAAFSRGCVFPPRGSGKLTLQRTRCHLQGQSLLGSRRPLSHAW